MAYIDFIEKIHKSTKRDYTGERVLNVNKAECAKISKKFGKDYWDGDRKYGYGGYQYDGRWKIVAQDLAKHYQLTSESKILDLGCGKGFLLYEFTKILPGIKVRGLDISEYAIENAKEEVKPSLSVSNILELPFETEEFDLVFSINVLHNLYIHDLWKAVKEIARVGNNKYIVVDSYRNEEERANLMYWQLTCECFYTPEEWEWIFTQCHYDGDFSCIYYE
jgi:ubiquinone/menaquinone biosynthesis C-methylase UbiE